MLFAGDSGILRSMREQQGCRVTPKGGSVLDGQVASQQEEIQKEIHLRMLRLLEDKPELTQRMLAIELGVSVGKANYCLSALADKGLIKVRNFRKSNNKMGYLYLLTPQGVLEKALMTEAFLKRKLVEFELLKSEIESLKNDIQKKP